MQKLICPVKSSDIEIFLNQLDFNFPKELIEFYKETDGAEILGDRSYISIWPLSELLELNNDYNVNEYAPDFFFFGSDGGDTGYAIQKNSGYIFEIPFIGMSNEDAVLKYNNFSDLLIDFE